ncbi:conserved hypothetical protein, partial [Ricinus communis]
MPIRTRAPPSRTSAPGCWWRRARRGRRRRWKRDRWLTGTRGFPFSTGLWTMAQDTRARPGIAEYRRHGAAPSSLGMVRDGRLRARQALHDAERFHLAHQLGDRARFHLAHGLAAVDLRGDLGNAHAIGDLLVHEARGHVLHHLALARREQGPAVARGLERAVGVEPPGIGIERGGHGVEHVLVAKGLGEEVDGAGLHGAHGHRDVAMAGHEDDRHVRPACLAQGLLECEAALAAQAHVEHQARGPGRARRRLELL